MIRETYSPIIPMKANCNPETKRIKQVKEAQPKGPRSQNIFKKIIIIKQKILKINIIDPIKIGKDKMPPENEVKLSKANLYKLI